MVPPASLNCLVRICQLLTDHLLPMNLNFTPEKDLKTFSRPHKESGQHVQRVLSWLGNAPRDSLQDRAPWRLASETQDEQASGSCPHTTYHLSSLTMGSTQEPPSRAPGRPQV